MSVPYEITDLGGNKTKVKWDMKLPIVCYADWSWDPKGLGGVKITGLKTEEAGKGIAPAI